MNPYAATDAASPDGELQRLPPGRIALTYWNACLAIAALLAFCTPFAAYDFWPNGDSVGRSLFPLAPLGLLTLLFCFVTGLVQAALLVQAFVTRAPLRFHRLFSLGILALCFVLLALASNHGWSIHV